MTVSTQHPAPHVDWPTLHTGQSRLAWLPAGTTVIVLAGNVTLEYPPRWLAGDTLGIRHTVTEGHAHVLDTSGWWGLYADQPGGAQLRVFVASVETPRWRWLTPLRDWLAALRARRLTSRGRA
ncbi:hypothetical protein [Ralstonia sp. UBA689]|uniref:hypothetical protein n=1 Tax=Ralstonia sp. UBA689 TaxID=1947373 RepID=UPI0025FE787E|nr:hypothetical protein [Ralstonia sp. UBA689]